MEDRFGLKNSLSINDLTYDRFASVVRRDVVERHVEQPVDEIVSAVDELTRPVGLARRTPATALRGVDDG